MEFSIVLIYDALYRMGFKGDRSGFFYLSYTVYLCITRSASTSLTTDWLYQAVAGHYHTTTETVQQRIEKSIARAWRTHPRQVESIAGHPLERCPRDTEVIRYVYRYLMDKYVVL